MNEANQAKLSILVGFLRWTSKQIKKTEKTDSFSLFSDLTN